MRIHLHHGFPWFDVAGRHPSVSVADLSRMEFQRIMEHVLTRTGWREQDLGLRQKGDGLKVRSRYEIRREF
jgi:hypothetical protein